MRPERPLTDAEETITKWGLHAFKLAAYVRPSW